MFFIFKNATSLDSRVKCEGVHSFNVLLSATSIYHVYYNLSLVHVTGLKYYTHHVIKRII